MSEKKMMLGNAAIARGVWEAGCKVSSAYPGTPSTEISEELVKYPEVYAEWAPNEKVAAEVAIGASISGVRSFCTMKMVGLNVAADPMYSFSYIGCNGGMVAVVADDPGLYSSQNEQDTRMVCRAAAIPCMEPADSQEAKDYIKYAYEISEKFDTPVIVRTTTRLAHSQCEVELCDREEIEDKPYERNIQKNVMMPGMAKKRHLVVEQRMKDLAEYANTAPFNTVEMGDMTLNGRKIGFITEGIAYQYVKEVCPNASILKLGMCHPLPKKLIEDFASKVDELYIFEELEPVVEEQVRSWGMGHPLHRQGALHDPGRVQRQHDQGKGPRHGPRHQSAAADPAQTSDPLSRLSSPRHIPCAQQAQDPCGGRYRMLHAGRAGTSLRCRHHSLYGIEHLLPARYGESQGARLH